jgi:hypothetical protein
MKKVKQKSRIFELADKLKKGEISLDGLIKQIENGTILLYDELPHIREGSEPPTLTKAHTDEASAVLGVLYDDIVSLFDELVPGSAKERADFLAKDEKPYEQTLGDRDDELARKVSPVLARRLDEFDESFGESEDVIRYFLGYRDILRDEVERRKREKQNEPRRENSKLPFIVRQHTFQEVRNLGQAITDGATLQNWKEIPGEVALGHTIEGQPIETKLTAGKDIDWFGAPVTYDSLREELRKLTPEGVLLFQFALESVLLHQHATLSLDDLIREIGWMPKNREDRNQMRQQIYYWLCVFTNLTSHGTRPGIYKDPITKEKGKIITSSSYFAITDKERLEDSDIPLRVTITASKWIADHKNDNAVLQHFGNIRKLAGLPTGQPRGEYALCIGLAAFQKWREDATRCETKRIGEQNVETVIYKPLARFDLLNMFRPAKFTIMDILKSDRPKRAQVYWNEAVTELKKRGVIGYYKAPDDKDLPRKGWQDTWLYGKNIEMRPFGDERRAAVELSKAANSKRKRFRNAKPKTKTP